MSKPTIWLVVLVLLSVAKSAFAARGPSVVLLTEGTDVDVQRELSDFVPQGVTLQSPEDLIAAVERRGVSGPIGEALLSHRARKQTLAAVRSAMKDVGASAVLSVQLTKGRAGARDMHVILMVPTQAEPVLEEDIKLSRGERAATKLNPLVSASLRDLGPPPARASADPADAAPAPARTEPPPPARKSPAVEKARPVERQPKRARRRKDNSEEEAEPTEEEEAAPAPEKDAVSKKKEKLSYANALVLADVGVGVTGRRFTYSDPVAGPLREYMAPAIGTYSISAEIYPAASTGTAIAKDIGIVGKYTGSLEVESKVQGSDEAARASFRRYAVGLRGRIRIGDKKDSPLIGVEGTYGVWTFAFSGLDQLIGDALLAAEYKQLRLGADARVPFGPFSLLGALGYMNISSAGAYSQHFPRATIAGLDAMAGGGYSVASFVDIRALVTYTRIFSSANPELDAPYVAGGTLDQYVALSLGASAIF